MIHPKIQGRDTMAIMPAGAQHRLNLWNQHLGEIPDSVWQQTDLESLVLADNDLAELSESIGRLKNLRMLDLGHNQLSKIPEAIGDLESLTDFLYLHDNQLTTLPESIEIKWLALPQHQRKPVHNAPGSSLQTWRSQGTARIGNLLTTLPDSISYLSSLRELHLRNNRLQTIPACIGDLRELRQIDLRGNPLTSLPSALAALPKLEKLDLRWVTAFARPAELPPWLSKLEGRGCLIYR